MTAMGHPSALMNHHHYEANLNKLPRAQSSLELLSQTAIEIESANSSPRSLILSRATSPTTATRVTPTVAAETLVLPELVHKTTSTTEMMVGSFPLHNENETGSNNNSKAPMLKHHYEYHHHAPLMPRPDTDYGTISSLATLMREPSGLYVTLLSGSCHQAGGGEGANLPALPDHIYRAASFTSSCGGSFHQATTDTTATTIAAGSTSTITTEPSSSTSASAVSLTSSSSDSNHQHHSQSENAWLRRELAAKDSTIATLQIQVQNLTQEIRQLRQLPTGKISQIPLE